MSRQGISAGRWHGTSKLCELPTSRLYSYPYLCGPIYVQYHMTMELKHAILGLLSIQPMSGYDLGRAFKGSVAHFWHADQSQIYRTIDRLADDQMIDTEVIFQDGKPNRNVHSLTELGVAELKQWLSSPLEVNRPKIPLLARLFFIAPLGPAAAERLLDEAHEQASEELEQLRAIDVGPTHDAASILRAATLNYGIEMAETGLKWVQDTREQLSAMKAMHHEELS